MVAFLIVGPGCDLPDRPPLPNTSPRPPIGDDEVETIRREVGLASPTDIQAVAIGPPPIGDHWFQLETSPLAPGGRRAVGWRRITVTDQDETDLLDDATWLSQWTVEASANDEPQARAAGKRSGRDSMIESVASERMWITQNDCTLWIQNDLRERFRPDGSLLGAAVRQQFGPLIHSSLLQVRQDETAGDLMTVRFGTGMTLRASWKTQTLDWTPLDRSFSTVPAAVSKMAAAETSVAEASDFETSDADAGDEALPTLVGRTLIFNPAPDALVYPPTNISVQRTGEVSAGRGQGRWTEYTASASIAARGDEPATALGEVYWTDSAGQIRRKLRADGLLEVAASADVLATMPPPRGGASMKIRGKPVPFDSAKSVALRISVVGADPSPAETDSPPTPLDPLSAAPGQAIRRADAGLDVLIARDGSVPDGSGFQVMSRSPDSSDTAATEIANYNHAPTRKLVRAATSVNRVERGEVLRSAENGMPDAGGVDREIATDHIAAVRSMLRFDPLDRVLLPADGLMNRGSGGSLAYSTMLVTLLRGRGIASRIAMGLVAAESVQAADPAAKSPTLEFRFWVVAYLDGKWHQIDASPVVDDQSSRSNSNASTVGEDILAHTDRLVLAQCDPTFDAIQTAISQSLDLMTRIQIEVLGSR